MQLSDLKSKLSARLGYSLNSTSKPTETEAESFIHEAIKKVVNLLPAEHSEGLNTQVTLTLVMNDGNVSATVPSDYNRFISMVDISKEHDIDILPPSKFAFVRANYDSILYPDYCGVRFGDKFIFSGVETTDTVYLTYQKIYTSSLISSIDNVLESAVLAYAVYLSKLQDEELGDSQLANQEFVRELEILGVKIGGRDNE